MSNRVIFNFDELFISVGIDVGSDFSWMSIVLPNQQFVGKPYKILHNSMNSLATAVSKIKEAEELYSLESRIFLESTGIYHYPLFCYLRDKGFNCSVINPIITKNSTNINIRKVHNDRFDSKKAALVGLKPDLKVSLMPSDLALNCRNLCREYYDLMDNRCAYVNKLIGELRMGFPQYLGIFPKLRLIHLLPYWNLTHLLLPFFMRTNRRLLISLHQQLVLDLHMLRTSIIPLFRLLMMLMSLVTSLTVTSRGSVYISASSVNMMRLSTAFLNLCMSLLPLTRIPFL